MYIPLCVGISSNTVNKFIFHDYVHNFNNPEMYTHVVFTFATAEEMFSHKCLFWKSQDLHIICAGSL